MDSLRLAVTRGTAITLVSIVAMRAIGFVTSLVLARRLGPEAFGAWVILIGFQAVVVVVAGLGLPLIAPKLVAEKHTAEARTAAILGGFLTAALVMGILAGVLVVAAAPWLTRIMVGPAGDPRDTAWLGFAVAAIVWSTATGAILQGRQQIQRLAIYSMGLTGLNLALLIPATHVYGLPGAIMALGVGHIVFALAVLAALPRSLRRLNWSREALNHVAHGLALGWPLLASTLLVPLVAWLGRTWLGRHGGLGSVGHYQVAETLNQAILFVPMAITMPLYPMIASLSRERPEEAVRTFAPVFVYVTLLSLPTAVIVGWLAPIWVGLFGPGYQDAAPTVALLTVGYFISSAGYLTGSFLAGFGMTGRGFLLNATWSVLYLFAAWLLVPRWGATGLAGAHVASYLVHTVILAVAVRRWIGLDIVPAPRLLVGGILLLALGLWLMPRLDPVAQALAAIPALLVSLALGGRLWRRAFERLPGWMGLR
ncbi:MAG: oligosaccharide flippase family protein [Candidatus Eisenbacteria bacterium]|nr:oligosaccharide flippase family protein [Candidatus Eisenbacteria bacterium]